MPMLLVASLAISGAADAVFAIAMIRQFTFDFGSGAVGLLCCFGFGIAAILAGILWGGSPRIQQPGKAFSSIQILTAVAGLIGFAALAIFRWMAPLALPALVLIGAEIPLFFAATASRKLGADKLSRIAGIAFSVKLGGAALGALLAGFIFLPSLGMWGTIAIASALHFAAGGIVASKNGIGFPMLGSDAAAERISRPIMLIAALAGFSIAAGAALWTRSLEPAAGTSVWSYATIAALFFFGLAAGFALSAWLAPTAKYPGLTLALIALSAGAVTVVAMFALPFIPRWEVLLFRSAEGSVPLFRLNQAALCAMVLVPLAALLGAMVPVTIRCAEGEHRPADWIARIGGVMCGAGLIGWIGGGALLVLAIGLRGGMFIVMAALAVIATIGAAWITPWTPRQRIAIACAPGLLTIAAMYAAPEWDRVAFASGVYAMAPFISQRGLETHFETLRAVKNDFYEDGSLSTVLVNSTPGHYFLWIDGRPDEDSAMVQPVVWEAPLVTGRAIRNIFVAGLGTGANAAALARRTNAQIDVVEREAGVIGAVSRLEGSLFRNPRLRIQKGDPRPALEAAAAGSYDLVIAPCSAPWIGGLAKLVTRDFYEIAKKRMTRGGIFAQTVTASRLQIGAIQSLLRTFTNAFPETLVLSSGRNAGELMLFGSDQPLRLDWTLMKQSEPRSGLSPGILISRILFGTAEARSFAENARENTDNNGALEFSSLANLYADPSAATGERLYAQAADPWNFVTGAPDLANRKDAIAAMVSSAAITNDLQRALKYAATLRAAGDEYNADRLTGNIYFMLDRRADAAALWTRCAAENPRDPRVLRPLVEYYRLLRPEQRPKEYETWLEYVNR